MRARTIPILIAAAAAGCALAHPAAAQGFEARPITIQTGDTMAAVVVSNPGDRKLYLETQVDNWSQDAAGHDVLTESADAVASPPAMWIGPHATYNVRVRLPAGAPGQERAYRLLLREIPSRADIVAGHVIFALTESLPAFSEPADLAPPSLSARLIDPRHLLIANEGGRRARLSAISQDGHPLLPGLAGYALGHSAVVVAVHDDLHPGAVSLATDVGTETIDLR